MSPPSYWIRRRLCASEAIANMISSIIGDTVAIVTELAINNFDIMRTLMCY